jgi:hypothetical protein
MSRARDFADLAGSADAGGISGSNVIINGAFQISQRGTSTTGGGFLVDRFELNINNTDNIAITQSQDSSGPSGFANSWKILATTAESAVAADERVRFRQNIEGQNLQQFAFGTSAAKSMTLSFYVKSNKTGTYAVNLEQDDASRVIGSTYTISSADTWEFKTITVGGDTSGTINDDNGAGLVVSWYLLAGSNYTATDNTSYGASADGKQAYGHSTTWGQGTNDNFFITGVQLELGEQATPFEHRSFADEMIRCQRYYQEVASGSTYFAGNGLGTTNIIVGIPLATSMRATPSIKQNGYTFHRSGNVNSSGANPSVSNFFYDIGRNAVGVRISGWASNNTDEVAYNVTPATEVLAFEAEL